MRSDKYSAKNGETYSLTDIDTKRNEIPALEAISKLKEGNRRFASDRTSNQAVKSSLQRLELADGQQPFATILGCSDSRVPVEMIFDQGVGDLFVIRVAGNVVAPSQIGSVEFAASQFGTQLVVILGHSNCGAVKATLAEIAQPTENQSPNLRSIVDRIGPSLRDLVDDDNEYSEDELIELAVKANVRSSLYNLRHGSEIIESMLESGDLLIVGAEYDLTSGRVNFFDAEN